MIWHAAYTPGMSEQDAATGNPVVVAALREAIAAAGGRITFAEYMAICLYDPMGGYYLQPERRPGRGGDFLTAPEAHPFFGLTLSRMAVEAWERLGEPARFTIREYGAGSGALAFDMLSGIAEERPGMLPVVRYRLAEPNRHRRAEALVALGESGFGEQVSVEDPDDGPLEPVTGMILANEVADALPVHRLVWRDGAPREIWVAAEVAGFAEAEGDLSPAMAAFDPAGWMIRQGVAIPDGGRVDISPASAAWMGEVAAGLARGYALVIDYGYEARELYRAHRLEGTVRAYREHGVTDDPFGHPGDEDLTAHVDFSLLRAAGEAAGMTFGGFVTQGELLAGLGLGDHLVALGQDPRTPAAEYYAAQAAVLRLIDPGAMGRFGALLMAKDAPVDPALRGMERLPGIG
jgi:SAM-dependent MidA family methyltransferase